MYRRRLDHGSRGNGRLQETASGKGRRLLVRKRMSGRVRWHVLFSLNSAVHYADAIALICSTAHISGVIS
jgi:hypothetical protein